MQVKSICLGKFTCNLERKLCCFSKKEIMISHIFSLIEKSFLKIVISRPFLTMNRKSVKLFQNHLFVTKDAQCSETYANIIFYYSFFFIEQNFQPVSKTLTTIADNKLAKGIQSESDRCLGADSLTLFFFLIFDFFFFAIKLIFFLESSETYANK